MPIFQPFKVVTCSFAQLIKGNTKGVTFKVNIVVIKYQAAQHGRVGLAELLFRNIGLLIKVCKNGQFKVKIVVFTAVLRFVSIELSQISQLFAISLHLNKLQICNLQIYSLQIYNLQIYSLQIYSLQIHNLNNRSNLVHILVYKGVVVHSLKIRCILANRVNSKATQVYKTNLIK